MLAYTQSFLIRNGPIRNSGKNRAILIVFFIESTQNLTGEI